VAPARAATDDVLVDERDPETGLALAQTDRGPQPGEPAAHDADVGDDVGIERRTRLTRVMPQRLFQPEAPRRPGVGHVDRCHDAPRSKSLAPSTAEIARPNPINIVANTRATSANVRTSPALQLRTQSARSSTPIGIAISSVAIRAVGVGGR